MNPIDVNALALRVRLADLAAARGPVRVVGESTFCACPACGADEVQLVPPRADRRDLWLCHGCGAAGDVYAWVMAAEGLDFAGALRRVGEVAG